MAARPRVISAQFGDLEQKSGDDMRGKHASRLQRVITSF